MITAAACANTWPAIAAMGIGALLGLGTLGLLVWATTRESREPRE